MSYPKLLCSAAILCCAAGLWTTHATSARPHHAAPTPGATLMNRVPLSFEANQGQFDQEARFGATGLGYKLLLTSTGAVLNLNGQLLRMHLEGAPAKAVSGV